MRGGQSTWLCTRMKRLLDMFDLRCDILEGHSLLYTLGARARLASIYRAEPLVFFRRACLLDN